MISNIKMRFKTNRWCLVKPYIILLFDFLFDSSHTIFTIHKNVAETKPEKETSCFVTWWIGDDSLETCDFLPWRLPVVDKAHEQSQLEL